MRGLRGALLLMPLLVASVAHAQDDKASTEEAAPTESETAILIWGPSSAVGQVDVARAGLAERLDPGTLFPARVLRVADWIGAARFRLGGNATQIPCTAPPADINEREEDELVALNILARQQIDELEFSAALEIYEEAIGRVPCQLVFLDTATAWETYFYAGISAFYAGQKKNSFNYFRQAAVLNPNQEWDESFPPEPQSTYLNALKDVIAKPSGRVFGDMRGTQYVEVRLDGASLDLTKAFETQVRSGQHMVQALDDRGQWTTWVRQVNEGNTLTFFSAQGAEDMLLDGPDGVLKNLAAADLTRRGVTDKLTDIYLVTVDPEKKVVKRVFRYAPDFQLWSRLEKVDGQVKATTEKADPTEGGGGATSEGGVEMTPKEKARHALLRDADFRSGATFGFKATSIFRCGPAQVDAAGRCPDGRPRKNDFMGGLVVIDVRLVKGLSLDFRFGLHVGDIQEGSTLLPEAGAGLKYRFLTGVVQPWAGAVADVFVGNYRPSAHENEEITVYPGVTGVGGVDFEMGDGFRLGLEGGGGVQISGEGNRSLNRPVVHGLVSIGKFMP